MRSTFVLVGLVALLAACARSSSAPLGIEPLAAAFDQAEFLHRMRILLEQRTLADPLVVQPALGLRLQASGDTIGPLFHANVAASYEEEPSDFSTYYGTNQYSPRGVRLDVPVPGRGYLQLRLPRGFCFSQEAILTAFRSRDWHLRAYWVPPAMDSSSPYHFVLLAESATFAVTASFRFRPHEEACCAAAALLQQEFPGRVRIPSSARLSQLATAGASQSPRIRDVRSGASAAAPSSV